MRRILSLVLAATAFAVAAQAQLTPEDRTRIETLIRQLGDREFAVREEATRKLIEIGVGVFPFVRKTLDETKDPEVSIRCERVLSAVRFSHRLVKDFGERPPDLFQIMHNANRETLILRVRRKGGLILIHEGKESAPYGGIFEYYLTNDPNRVIYIAQAGNKAEAVVDDFHGVYDSARSIRISPDGLRAAFLAKRGDRQFAVLDGVELPAYDDYSGIGFTKDSRHLVSGTKRRDRWVLAVDASEGPEHDSVAPALPAEVPGFVAIDGTEVWMCRIELPAKERELPPKLEEKKVKLLARLDAEYAKRRPVVSAATDRCVVLSADGPAGTRVYSDGRLAGTYDSSSSMIFSADQAHVAAIMQTAAGPARQKTVVWDDKVFGPYDAAHLPVFSADGRHLAFFALRNGQWFIVLDGKEGPPSGLQPSGLVFSADGQHLAARFDDETETCVLLDDKEVGRYTRTLAKRLDPEYRSTLRPVGLVMSPNRPALTFSPDGKHLAWVGWRRNTEFVVCDGREGLPYLLVDSVRFSEDGEHLCYMAAWLSTGPRTPVYCMVVDGVACPPGDLVIPPHAARRLDRLRYITLEDNRFKLVEVDWPKWFDWTNGLKAP